MSRELTSFERRLCELAYWKAMLVPPIGNRDLRRARHIGFAEVEQREDGWTVYRPTREGAEYARHLWPAYSKLMEGKQ